MECPKCGKACGWICEAHPELPWPHEDESGKDCPGPGRPCDEPGCEHSLFGTTPQTPGVMDRMRAGVESRGGTVICAADDDPDATDVLEK